ncbi:hypothetical protein F5B20DRAFT_588818 [Whalleya microplaca]|nr:hypothetical protein F5B20DRAFT_588818 [Whalleya microplaca]
MPVAWDDKADRDLLIAMLLSHNSENGKPKTPPWDKVTAMMTKLGYETSKDALNQRWGKVLLKNLKKDHPDMFTEGPETPVKGVKSGAASSPATPASKKRGRKPKASKATVDPEDDNSDAGPDAKKIKTEGKVEAESEF